VSSSSAATVSSGPVAAAARCQVAEAHAQGGLLHCPVELIDGAGHHPQSEFPDRTAAALVPFVAHRGT
jgi:pimeloyl-ACP methyl ester carboxylesterase